MGEIVFERFDDGTVIMKGEAPGFARMTWEFVQGSHPDMVKFWRDQVTFLDKVTYLMARVSPDGTIELELLEDRR